MKRPAISKKSRRITAGDQESVNAEVRQLRPSTMIQRLHRKMAGEQVNKFLSEHLVEKIVAMMPFPSIFKARCLSKSWLSKFEPISSQDDEKKKHLSRWFQKEVRQWSNRWGSFCHLGDFDGHLVCFDQTFQKRMRFPPLTFVPSDWTVSRFSAESGLRVDGPLIYYTPEGEEGLHVANVLTRKWKKLAPRPNAGPRTMSSTKIVISGTTMIIFCQDDELKILSAQIYDCELEAWRSSKFDISDHDYNILHPAYLNGVVYMLPHTDLQNLLAFNLEESTWKVFEWSTWIGFPLNRTNGEVQLLACNAVLWMTVDCLKSITVLRIDLESLYFLKVANLRISEVEVIKIPLREGKRLFYCVNNYLGRLGRMLAYDPHKFEWSYVSILTDLLPTRYNVSDGWHPISFQPGLNPFMELWSVNDCSADGEASILRRNVQG